MTTQLPAGQSPEERRALLARLLRDKARGHSTSLPLSYGQRALYFIHQLAPDSSAYNVAFAASVYSPVKVDALQRAFQALVDRHAALRTSFVMSEEGPVQRVAGAADVDFAAVDAGGWDDARLQHEVSALYEQPFDLAQLSLMRVRLITRSATDHVLLMTVHHIVFDGWSMGIVLDELARLYAAELDGTPASLRPVERQYADVVAWQHAMLASPEGERLRAYWHTRLSGTLPVLDLPFDKPRPAVQQLRGESHSLILDRELTRALLALAKTEHTTLYTLFLAAFYVLLHRLSGQEDIIIGTPMAGRSRPEFQQTVGYLVSPVPLRVTISGAQPFRSFLAQVRQTLHEAIAHEDFPFSLLIEQLQPKRDPGRMPIMEVLFSHQQTRILGKLADQMAKGEATTGAALQLEPYHISQESGQFDLSLLLIESEEDFVATLKYNTDLFEPETIRRMTQQFTVLLDGIVAAPEQAVGALPILTNTERELIFGAWNATEVAFPRERCIHDLIAEQAARSPEAIAARFGEQHISYRTLDQRANQLAHHLRNLGVGPDVLVGIYLERSLDMLIALLGVLKAGGAYVPLDPGFPRERLVLMLEDAAAPVVITQESLADEAPDHSGATVLIDGDWPAITLRPDTPPDSGVQPEHLAYVIFTSGSTGRPKGVQIPHRAVVNFLNAMRVRPGLAHDDILVAVTTLSFDIAVLELYLPLVVGAQVVLADRETAADGVALSDLLLDSGATVMQATPISWRLLLEAGWQPAGRFKALCGGEALPPELAHALKTAGVELWNMYGPTETTVWSAVYPIDDVAGPPPIGHPIDNTQLYVLNPQQQQQPIAVVGELYIGGAGLARGYHGHPDLTAERFVPDPFSSELGARLYRTGDLARFGSNGVVAVLGRTDHQVKIRGYRIELGEIEAALIRHPAVRAAVVIARDDGRGILRLMAYLVPEGDAAPQPGQLRLHLRESLPDYMIPAAFMTLEQLPLTPNGKIDRRALPLPEAARARGDEGYAAPTTPTEQTVAAVWCEVLSLDRVGLYDHFYDLGGHSLLAVEALTKLERQLGIRLNPGLLSMQTLGQLAANYDDLLRQKATIPPTVAESPDHKQPSGLGGRLFGAAQRTIASGEKQG